MKETVVRAKHGGLVDISSVALFKRLKLSGEWLRWMACSLMTNWFSKQSEDLFGSDLRVRLIDGSNVQEPGSTGSSWKIHYSVGLPSLLCDEVYVTGPKIGESFKRFKIRHGDLLLGDRGYANRLGIAPIGAPTSRWSGYPLPDARVELFPQSTKSNPTAPKDPFANPQCRLVQPLPVNLRTSPLLAPGIGLDVQGGVHQKAIPFAFLISRLADSQHGLDRVPSIGIGDGLTDLAEVIELPRGGPSETALLNTDRRILRAKCAENSSILYVTVLLPVQPLIATSR